MDTFPLFHDGVCALSEQQSSSSIGLQDNFSSWDFGMSLDLPSTLHGPTLAPESPYTHDFITGFDDPYDCPSTYGAEPYGMMNYGDLSSGSPSSVS